MINRKPLSLYPPPPCLCLPRTGPINLEFRKGIKSAPSDLVFSSWVPLADASACPDDFYCVIFYAAAFAMVVVALDDLGPSGFLKFSNLIRSQGRTCVWSGSLLADPSSPLTEFVQGTLRRRRTIGEFCC
ncbi:leucine-rich receptor-like protein kinase family protein [Striga asiatica]|uniref:Leucine-rich receptor-like protein kinase family protein n=1 Tax=Striga asiatica TaxID=4170 RepID=A0A5A7R196_STRAF|nr:leucine-rich receptor-like protein kinase family protein [Striga asiatica]